MLIKGELFIKTSNKQCLKIVFFKHKVRNILVFTTSVYHIAHELLFQNFIFEMSLTKTGVVHYRTQNLVTNRISEFYMNKNKIYFVPKVIIARCILSVVPYMGISC